MFKKFTVFLLFLGIIAVIVGVVLSEGDFTELESSLINRFTYEYENVTMGGSELVDNLEIDLINNNVYINYSDDESYSLDFFSAEEDWINVSLTEGKLLLKGNEKKWNKFFNFHYKTQEHKKVVINLPKSFIGDIKADITAGILELNEFTINNLDATITSGRLKIQNSNINDINSEITSGEVNLNNIICNRLIADVTSGKISLDKVITNDATLNITSGKINVLASEINTINVDVTSGTINLEAIIASSITTDITTGVTNISVVGNIDDYRMILDSITGKIYNNGNKVGKGTINPNGNKHINANSTSGNISISFIS